MDDLREKYKAEIKNGTVIAVTRSIILNRGGDAPTIGRHKGYDDFWKPLIDREAPEASGKWSTPHIVNALGYGKPDTRVGEITIRFSEYYLVCR